MFLQFGIKTIENAFKFQLNTVYSAVKLGGLAWKLWGKDVTRAVYGSWDFSRLPTAFSFSVLSVTYYDFYHLCRPLDRGYR